MLFIHVLGFFAGVWRESYRYNSLNVFVMMRHSRTHSTGIGSLCLYQFNYQCHCSYTGVRLSYSPAILCQFVLSVIKSMNAMEMC